jgi:hypothetical protein
MNPMGLEVGDRRNRAARSRVPGDKETSRPYASFESQKDVDCYLVRGPSIKTGAAHEPWRRVDGFHLNGLRR